MGRNLDASVVSALVLLAAVFLPACDGGSPSAPSPSASVAPESTPPPTPLPNVPQLVGVWKLALGFTAVSGSGCVAETMRSQMGMPSPYSLVITRKGDYSVALTLKTASGDRACTFTPVMDDSGGFTTSAPGGYYRCAQWYLDFRCNDGTLHGIFTIGENVSGRVTGNEISGVWSASWFDGWEDYSGIETRAEFTGKRQ